VSRLDPAVWYRASRRLVGEHEGSLYAFLARAWASGAGLVLVVLVTTRLTAVEQGYFFTFQTLLTFQFVLELGFAVVLSQFASHEWAHLRLEGGRIEGDPEAHARLVGMVRLARRWYLGASVGFLLLVAPAGVLFFQLRDDGTVSWLWPWLALCVAQVISFQYTPLQALLEGVGDVARSQRALLIANVAAGFGAWIALLGGLGLWAAPLQLALRSAIAFALLYPATRPLRASSPLDTRAFEASWRPAFFRQQMRTSASWSAGLLMFQSVTPITFAMSGPIVAGQIGLLASALTALNQLGSAWLTAAQPRMGYLGAVRRFDELRALVRVTLWRCVGTTAVLVGGVLVGIAILHAVQPTYAQRFGSVTMVVAFLGAAVVMQVSNVWTSAVRFQKEEPFVLIAWVAGVAVVVTNVVLGYAAEGNGVAIGFLLVISFILVPGVTLIGRARLRALARSDGA